jgi:hypothetical protein
MSFIGVYTYVAHAGHFLMLAEELSTIPLNLKAIYHQQARLHDIFARLFVITFILSRLIYGTIICFCTFRAIPKFIQMASNLGDTTSIVLAMVQVLLFILTRLLNLYWTVLIVCKVTAVFRSKKPRISANSAELKKKVL